MRYEDRDGGIEVSGREYRAFSFIAMAQNLLPQFYKDIAPERIRRMNKGMWRVKTARTLLRRFAQDMYDSFPTNAQLRVDRERPLWHLSIKIQPIATSKGAEYCCVKVQDLDEAMKTIMHDHCRLCLKEGYDEVRDCRLRKLMMVYNPPEEFLPFTECPYRFGVWVDEADDMSGKVNEG